MKNRTFRSLVTWLIIASPLWWTSGCYSEVTKLSDAVGSEIEVVTKGNNVYTFKIWSSDGFGGVSGDAEWQVPLSDRFPSMYAKRYLTLPIDSIKSVSTKASNTGVYLATASVISVGFILGLAYFAISSTTFRQW